MLFHLTPSQHSDLIQVTPPQRILCSFYTKHNPFPQISITSLSLIVSSWNPLICICIYCPYFAVECQFQQNKNFVLFTVISPQPRIDAWQINIGCCIFVDNSLEHKFYLKMSNLIFYFHIKINMVIWRSRLYKMLIENMRLQGKSPFAEAALS